MIKRLTIIFKDFEEEEVLNLSSLNNGDKMIVIDVKTGNKTAVKNEELETAMKELKEFNNIVKTFPEESTGEIVILPTI